MLKQEAGAFHYGNKINFCNIRFLKRGLLVNIFLKDFRTEKNFNKVHKKL